MLSEPVDEVVSVDGSICAAVVGSMAPMRLMVEGECNLAAEL